MLTELHASHDPHTYTSYRHPAEPRVTDIQLNHELQTSS